MLPTVPETPSPVFNSTILSEKPVETPAKTSPLQDLSMRLFLETSRENIHSLSFSAGDPGRGHIAKQVIPDSLDPEAPPPLYLQPASDKVEKVSELFSPGPGADPFKLVNKSDSCSADLESVVSQVVVNDILSKTDSNKTEYDENAVPHLNLDGSGTTKENDSSGLTQPVSSEKPNSQNEKVVSNLGTEPAAPKVAELKRVQIDYKDFIKEEKIVDPYEFVYSQPEDDRPKSKQGGTKGKVSKVEEGQNNFEFFMDPSYVSNKTKGRGRQKKLKADTDVNCVVSKATKRTAPSRKKLLTSTTAKVKQTGKNKPKVAVLTKINSPEATHKAHKKNEDAVPENVEQPQNPSISMTLEKDPSMLEEVVFAQEASPDLHEKKPIRPIKSTQKKAKYVADVAVATPQEKLNVLDDMILTTTDEPLPIPVRKSTRARKPSQRKASQEQSSTAESSQTLTRKKRNNAKLKSVTEKEISNDIAEEKVESRGRKQAVQMSSYGAKTTEDAHMLSQDPDGSSPPKRLKPTKKSTLNRSPIIDFDSQGHIAVDRTSSKESKEGEKCNESSLLQVSSDIFANGSSPLLLSQQLNLTQRNRVSSLRPAGAYRIAFTGFSEKTAVTLSSLHKMVKSLGGAVEDSGSNCTHLVADKIKRTVKLLCGVGRGIPVLSVRWLQYSSKGFQFEDLDGFFLKDSEMESQYGFSLVDTLSKAANQPLLKGLKIFVSKSVKPPPAEMKEIVEASGGKVLTKFGPTTSSEGVYAVTCTEDLADKNIAQANKMGIPVVSAEFLLCGILKYQLEPDRYSLLATTEGSEPTTSKQQRKRKK